METIEGTPDTIGNTLGTGNRVNNTDCFFVDSVDPAAGGLQQVTHSEHQEQPGHRGGKIGKTGNKREHISNTGFNREHWEQWRPHRDTGHKWCVPYCLQGTGNTLNNR